MKTTIFTLLLLCFAVMGSAQTPIIFQPGPGNNDNSDMGTIDAGMDAFIVQNTEGTYGDNPSLVSLPPSNCNETQSIIYIRFDVSTLPDMVDSVFVNFYHFAQTNYCYSNCDAYWAIASLVEEWGEMNVDWFNDVNYEGEYVTNIHFAFPDTGGWHKYNITSLYNDWKSGNVYNYGMAIYGTTEGCNNAAIMFYTASSDDTTAGGAHRPYLEVYETATDVPSTPLDLSAQIYPNPAGQEVNVSYTLTQAMPITFSLQDLSGKQYYTENIVSATKGKHIKNIPLDGLANGMYMLLLETPNGVMRQKLIVK